MAHNLNNNHMAYTGARPWHELGTQIPGLMTVREALRFGKLDYQVEKKPAYYLRESMGPNGISLTPERIPGKWATVRSDTTEALGAVGDRYTIIQNESALDFFDNAIREGSASIETVGALGRGERVFMMAKTPETMEIAPGDPCEGFLLFENSHDGSATLRVLFTAVRVVCQNTVNAAISGAKNIHKIRHTTNAKDKLREAHLVLAESADYWQRWQQAAREMTKRDMSRLDTIALFEKLFPGDATRAKNIRNDLLQLVNGKAKGSDLPGSRGTAWGVYNAVTQYLGSERTTRNGNTNWEAETFGSGVAVRQQVWDLLTA